MNFQERFYKLSRGVESLSKEEHGRFFDAIQTLGLSNEVKEAAVVLYLDFKNRPVGDYNAGRKNLDIFLVASVSLAAKVMGELRTDQEVENKLYVGREKLIDAEERILKSLGVQESRIPFPDFTHQLSQRQIESMTQDFLERELVNGDQAELLASLSEDYLQRALENGLNLRMSYRGRAAGVMFKAVRDLNLPISETDIARAAGFDKKSMTVNANIIRALLDNPKK